ncbi:MAG: hypothetical protein LBI82_05750 [Dysgonamonadaceae bacterium]|jgi:hypothetical protein|nr:hypothetical protein [Dysgonamonadaceae bacterium]
MQTAKKTQGARRRRTSNRHASNYRFNRRMNTSLGQVVHISSYISPLMNTEGNVDREKFINLFNSECYA